MTTEEWRDIKGFEGKYQISNFGRVKSLLEWHGNKHISQYRPMEKIVKPTDNGHGYLIVGLKNHNKRTSRYVHRLVAEAFVENPKNENVVNHLDYDITNNRADNLEWCSTQENVLYSKDRMPLFKNTQPPKSGYKYIRHHKRKRVGDTYEVNIRIKDFYLQVTTKDLQTAINKRDEFLKGVIEGCRNQ